jgi:hypothetical protein
VPTADDLLELGKHYDIDRANGVWMDKWHGHWSVIVRHTHTGPMHKRAADALAWCRSEEGQKHMAPLLEPGYNGIRYRRAGQGDGGRE